MPAAGHCKPGTTPDAQERRLRSEVLRFSYDPHGRVETLTSRTRSELWVLRTRARVPSSSGSHARAPLPAVCSLTTPRPGRHLT